MVIVVGGLKGGVGKTTIAVHLLAYLRAENKDVVIGDADMQESTIDWSFAREQCSPDLNNVKVHAMASSADATSELVDRLSSKHEYVVIDAGGRDTAVQRAALLYSDMFIVPMGLSGLDLWSVERSEEQIHDLKKIHGHVRAIVLPNMVQHHARPRIDGLKQALAGAPLEFAPMDIPLRSAYQHATSIGSTVIEEAVHPAKPYKHKRAYIPAAQEICEAFEALKIIR